MQQHVINLPAQAYPHRNQKHQRRNTDWLGVFGALLGVLQSQISAEEAAAAAHVLQGRPPQAGSALPGDAYPVSFWVVDDNP